MHKKRPFSMGIWLMVSLVLFSILRLMNPSAFFGNMAIAFAFIFWMILLVPLLISMIRKHRWIWGLILTPSIIFLALFLVHIDGRLKNRTVELKLHDIITSINRDGTLPEDVVLSGSEGIESEKGIIKLPSNYTIQGRDYFFGTYDYYVEFENGQSGWFYVSKEPDDTWYLDIDIYEKEGD